VPPAGFFDPYFEDIRTHMHNLIAPIEGNLDQRFEHAQGFLQEHLIDPLQTSVCNLTERVELLVSREELQEVRNDSAANAQNIKQLRQSYDNLAAHIYLVF
jgi:hypothetical protein